MADTATWQVHHKRAEELLAELPDNSVDLILTDPPYFKVKRAAWDNQWKTEAEFLAWLGTILEQYRRVLKPNGSLYVFASPQMAAEVEVLTKRSFHVVNSITWRKAAKSYAEKYGPETFRGFVEMSERIVFAEHYGADNTAKGEVGYGAVCDDLRGSVFEPVRAYLDGERKRAGVPHRAVIAHLGMTGHDSHFFSAVQWKLPLPEQYAAMRELFNRSGGKFLDIPYDYLQRECEDLQTKFERLRRQYEDLRRPFAVDASVPYTDVWDFPTVSSYPGKHECEKPQELLQHIIKASSRPGATVLDTFMGGGSTGQACMTLGRDFIGCDMDEHWHGYTLNRLRTVEQQLAQGGPVVWPIGRQTKPKTQSRPNSLVEQVRLF